MTTSKQTDNRMAWIRNLEAVKSTKKMQTVEHEFESECRIPGLLDYANQKLLCGMIVTNEEPGTSPYQYSLQIQYPDDYYDYKPSDATKGGYYFPEEIGGELLSLFSVFFQCRFFQTATNSCRLTSMGLPVRMVYRRQPHVRLSPDLHPKVLQDNASRKFGTGLGDFLDKVHGLDAAKHKRFIFACWHYARALREIGLDSEMVFIRLVSAIEFLAEGGTLPMAKNPLEGADFESILAPGALSDQQVAQLKKLLRVDRHGKIRVRKHKAQFIQFINEHSKGCLKGGNWKAKGLKIQRKDIPKVAGTIYDARSAYLHTGEPMYLSQFVRNPRSWDMDPGLGMMIDKKRFPASKKLPYTYWFEDLVRCCLLNYLEHHSSTSDHTDT